jgi:hypothetical protein
VHTLVSSHIHNWPSKRTGTTRIRGTGVIEETRVAIAVEGYSLGSVAVAVEVIGVRRNRVIVAGVETRRAAHQVIATVNPDSVWVVRFHHDVRVANVGPVSVFLEDGFGIYVAGTPVKAAKRLHSHRFGPTLDIAV